MLEINKINLFSVKDARGVLTAVEGGVDIPFEIKRVFYMHHVVKGAARGGHAHRDTDQIAIAVSGSINILLSDGEQEVSVTLDDPSCGLYLPRMTWTALQDFGDNGVCLVLASSHYDMNKSIRDWGSYLTELNLMYRLEPHFDSLKSWNE